MTCGAGRDVWSRGGFGLDVGAVPYPQVVRVFATTQSPDYDQPWRARSPSSGSGSGVVCGPGRILTGAHVVADATFVQVQRVDVPDKAIAEIKAICHDSDLALLEVVDDSGLLDDVPAAEFDALPERGDKVSVVGFPVGGDQVSITEGVVSRIEAQYYSHSFRKLLAVTVDAAINRGNSGGPVFKDDKVVGIAFQTLSGATNIGEVVPSPLIRQFLEGVERGRPAAVPCDGIRAQDLENPTLRRAVGIEKGVTGVLVAAIAYDSTSYGVLRVGDILHRIGGYDIANNGTIAYLGRFRTVFDAVLGDGWIGDTIDVEITRDGERMELELTLKGAMHLVPRISYGAPPTYFVFGGFVFQPLTREYLATWRDWWDNAPKEFTHLYYNGIATDAQREVVVVSHVLADAINVGYDLYNLSVTTVNGYAPRDMQDFIARVDGAEGLVEIGTSRGGLIVLDRKEVRAAMPRIQARYHIPEDRSADLR